METEFISTAFPYAYGIPHLGNLCQAVKADTYNKLRNSFYNSKSGTLRSKFCYSYHLTGLPTYLRIEQLKKHHLEQGSNFNTFLESYLKEKKLEPLIPYLTESEALLNPKSYLSTLNVYYTQVFNKLGISSSLPDYHTTTAIDPLYSRFVNLIYKKLFEKQLLKQKFCFNLFCDTCKNPLGDHDRLNFEGIGVNPLDLRIYQDKQNFLILNKDQETKDLEVVELTPNVFLSIEVYVELYNNTVSYQPIDFVLESSGTRLRISADLDSTRRYYSFKSGVVKHSLQKAYYTLANIKCRCGGHGQIKKNKTWVINFQNQDWKTRTNENILGSINRPSIKKALINNSNILRDMNFLRTRGYGTPLDILDNTEYQGQIVDSLFDSCIHPYYYGVLQKGILKVEDLTEKVFDQVLSETKVKLHCVGKDLLKNHVLFFCYILTALAPNNSMPYFDTTRFIVVSGNEKMSKSKGNVIYHENLVDNQITGTEFRNFLCFATDEDVAISVDYQSIKTNGTLYKNQASGVLESLKDFKEDICADNYYLPETLMYIAKSLDLKSEALSKIDSIGPKNYFKLRAICNKILSNLRSYIRSKKKIALSGVQKQFLWGSLYNPYDLEQQNSNIKRRVQLMDQFSKQWDLSLVLQSLFNCFAN